MIRTPPRRSNAPRTKRTRTITRKRVYGPRAGTFGLPLVVPRPFPLPPLLRNTLKYSERINVGLNASNLGSNVFGANTLFSCNLSTAGHQPLCWDQLTLIYRKAAVVSSKITYTCHPGIYSYTVIGLVDDDTNISTGTLGLYPAGERPYSKAKVVGATGSNAVYLTSYYNCENHFGKGAVTNDAQQNSPSANASEVAVFGIFVNGIGSMTCIIDVTIEYFVQWSEFESILAS